MTSTHSDLSDIVLQGNIDAVTTWIKSFHCDLEKECVSTTPVGVKPLFTAFHNSYQDIFNILLKSRIINTNEKNTNGDGIIHAVCVRGDVAILEILIQHGADVNLRDIDGRTPLHKATRENHVDVIRCLVDHGSDVNARTEGSGESVLHYSISRSADDTVKCLISSGCSLNERSRSGDTPLHVAVHEERLKAVELICESGANTDILNTKGLAAIHLAIKLCKWEILDYLIRINASINLLTSSGETTMLMASALNNAESRKVIEQLFRAGYNVRNDSWIWNNNFCLFEGGDGLTLKNFIHTLTLRVHTLRELSCFIIRKSIGTCVSRTVDKLPLPVVLKQSITCPHTIRNRNS